VPTATASWTGSPTTSRGSVSCRCSRASPPARCAAACPTIRRPSPSPSPRCSTTSTRSCCPGSPTGTTRRSTPTSRSPARGRGSSARRWPRPSTSTACCGGPRRRPRSSRRPWSTGCASCWGLKTACAGSSSTRRRWRPWWRWRPHASRPTSTYASGAWPDAPTCRCFASTPPRTPIPRWRRPPSPWGWVATGSGWSPPTTSTGWTPRRWRRRSARTCASATGRSRSCPRSAPPRRRRSTPSPASPTSVTSWWPSSDTICGSTSTAPTGRWPPSARACAGCSTAWSAPTRS
jgi:hypothetical protein